MKYFTKERYEEMQIAGFLVFPETIEEWEDQIAWFNSEELNFLEMSRSNLAV